MTHSESNATAGGAGCPSISALEAHLQGDALNEHVLQHFESCASCTNRLEEMRQINVFLASLTHDLDDAIAALPPAGIPAPVEGLTFHREIGRGGQGVVYEAMQEGTNRTVAVKALRLGAMESERQLARFRREIRLVASLNHPNIVTIHDVVDLPHGQLAYTMQYIDGVTLKDWMQQAHHGLLSRRRRVSATLVVFVKIIRAVAYAHSKGVIHRDLKPSNILVDAEHEPHILDFGIACTLGEPAHGQEEHRGDPVDWDTRTDEFVGSPQYAAPEQLTPGASIDERTDVYALGVMLGDAMKKDGVLETSSSHHGVFVDLDWIIARATAKNPDDRYESATAFAEDLVRLMDRRPIAARPRSIPYIARRAMQRRPTFISATASVAVLVTVIMLVVFNQLNRLEVQSVEIGRTQYLSSIDRANSFIDSGSFLDAEQLLWDALLTGSFDDEVDVIETTGPGLTSPALWGLRSLYARQPCIGSIDIGLQGEKYSPLIGFDESGSLLFVLSERGVLETWDWRSASLLRSVQLTEGPILSMALAPHSSLAAVVTQRDPHLLTLYDMRRGESVGKYDCSALIDSSQAIGRPALAISAGASRLAVGVGRSVLLFDRVNKKSLQIDLAKTQAIASLDFDSDAKRLLVVGKRIAFELRDTSSGQLLSATEYADQMDDLGQVRDGWFLPEEDLLVFAGDTQYVFDSATNEARWVSWHNQSYSVRGSDSGSNQVATAFATEIVVGQMGTGDENLLLLRGHRSSIRSLALHGESQVLASLDAKGVVRFWDISGSQPVRSIQTSSSTVFAVNTSLDGQRIFSGDSNGALRTWSWRNAATVAGIEAQLDGMISRIAVSPNGEYLAVGGDNKDPRLLLFSLRTGARIMDLRTLTRRVTGLAFSPNSTRLAVSSNLECLVVDLSVNTDPRIRRTVLNRRIKGLDFSADGKTIVCTGPNSIFSLDADTLMEVDATMTPTSVPRHIAASPVDDIVVVEGDDSALTVFDRSSGRSIGKLIGHSLSDHWMDFHASGELLLSAGEDGVLKIWDMRSMRCLATFKAHGAALFCARFIPGSLRAVTGDTRGLIGLWDFGSLDQYIAGNLEAMVARHGEEDLPPERLRRLRAWAKTINAAI